MFCQNIKQTKKNRYCIYTEYGLHFILIPKNAQLISVLVCHIIDMQVSSLIDNCTHSLKDYPRNIHYCGQCMCVCVGGGGGGVCVQCVLCVCMCGRWGWWCMVVVVLCVYSVCVCVRGEEGCKSEWFMWHMTRCNRT